MIKISIIVPVYNVEAYLKKCIDSLINQTLKEIEIILINDGSTDKSMDIIKSYTDTRIVFIDKNNTGIGSTRNLGIEKAKGQYLSFIDADDYVSEYFCERMYQKAKESNCDIVICDYYKDGSEYNLIKINSFADTSLKDNPNLINDINLGPCNKIFKRILFNNKENRFIENLKYEDAPLICKLLCKAKKIGKLDEPLHYYVIHKKSQTTIHDNRIFDILKITDKIFNILNQYSYLKVPTVNLIVMILTDYIIQQRYIRPFKMQSKFIDEAFDYLNMIDKNWKKCDYLKKISLSKRVVKTNKILTKLYCKLYALMVKRDY